jgi:hypothetical protein
MITNTYLFEIKQITKVTVQYELAYSYGEPRRNNQLPTSMILELEIIGQ